MGSHDHATGFKPLSSTSRYPQETNGESPPALHWGYTERDYNMNREAICKIDNSCDLSALVLKYI